MKTSWSKKLLYTYLKIIIIFSATLNSGVVHSQFNITCETNAQGVLVNFLNGTAPFNIEVNNVNYSGLNGPSYFIDDLICGAYSIVVTDNNNSSDICNAVIPYSSDYMLSGCLGELMYIPVQSVCFEINDPCYYWTAIPSGIVVDPSLSYQEFILLEETVLNVVISDGQGNIAGEINLTIAIDNGPNCDSDGDGIQNSVDNCIDIYNPLQLDFDNDGIGDLCETPLNDIDGDGIPDDQDPCPGYFENLDTDGDGICDNVDNCIDFPNVNQTDVDGDGIGDDCDPFIVLEETDEPCDSDFLIKEIKLNPEGIIVREKILLCDDGNGNPTEDITLKVENNYTNWEWTWDQGQLVEGVDYIGNELYKDAFGDFTVTALNENDCEVSYIISVLSIGNQMHIREALKANGFAEIDVDIIPPSGQCTKSRSSNLVIDDTGSAVIYKGHSFCLYDMAVNIADILAEDGTVGFSYVLNSFCSNGITFRQFLNNSQLGRNISLYLVQTKTGEGKLYSKITSSYEDEIFSEGSCDIHVVNDRLDYLGKYQNIRNSLKQINEGDLSSIAASGVIGFAAIEYSEQNYVDLNTAINDVEESIEYIRDCLGSLIMWQSKCVLIPRNCWDIQNGQHIAKFSGFANAMFNDIKYVIEYIATLLAYSNNPYLLSPEQKEFLLEPLLMLKAINDYLKNPQSYFDMLSSWIDFANYLYGDGDLPLSEAQNEYFNCIFTSDILIDNDCAYKKGELFYIVLTFAEEGTGFSRLGSLTR